MYNISSIKESRWPQSLSKRGVGVNPKVGESFWDGLKSGGSFMRGQESGGANFQNWQAKKNTNRNGLVYGV